MTKSIKISTAFLGFSMFLFGVLKFVNPFKGWYTAQIVHSELPFPVLAYWSGQLGEILVGSILLTIVFFKYDITLKRTGFLFILANLSIVFMMLGAFYVHLNLNVPADVLPLKIRPPYIPGVFMIIAIINLIYKTRVFQSDPKD